MKGARGPALSAVGFDADDTLWQNEKFFRLAQERFGELMSDYAERGDLDAMLLETEKKNLNLYGFGAKGFTLSMIETALQVGGDRVPASVIGRILDAGRELKSHPLELLPGAREALERLAGIVPVVLITKGDLIDQERKISRSGLEGLFDGVEIVSDKTEEVYARIFGEYCSGAERAMMVGNSLKSDIVPALRAGSWAAFIPHGLTWEFEHADRPDDSDRFIQLPGIGALPDAVFELFDF